MANKRKLIAEKYQKRGRMSNNREWATPKIIPVNIRIAAIIEHTQANSLNTFFIVFGFLD
jgi:hypothetical protein